MIYPVIERAQAMHGEQGKKAVLVCAVSLPLGSFFSKALQKYAVPFTQFKALPVPCREYGHKARN